MTGRAAYGIVAIAAADLRREPRHASELRSQLLLGETVRIDAERSGGQWLRVTGREDSYAGWMRAWALVRVAAGPLRRWQARARARVVRPVDTLRSLTSPRRPLMPVFLGSRLELLKVARGRAVVRLPDGRQGSLPATSLRSAGRDAIGLKRRLASLAGVPYLWGGRTPAGLDCSGLTQLVLGEQGVALPRDACDQYRATRRLERAESVQMGDLVFFARAGEQVSHVGILLDHGTYVHCRGTVHEASLDPLNPLCEKDLLAQFRGYGRPWEGRAEVPIHPARRA
ncbi:MAG: C40 family peptidase [Candidatus Eisenbacteria bacterium]